MRWKSWQPELMGAALEEAEKGRGKTYPNPAVGAVVARGKRIAGRGFHKRWGRPHAEVEALKDAGRLSTGGDLYVTLEPCCHWGKTPPCTDAIVNSGIRRVFVSTYDPNPVVKGRGIRALRRAGIQVSVGLEAQAARRVNESYFRFMETGRPFVTLKVAQTLDGKIATRAGRSKWITGPDARRLARRMRAEAQAILVGVNTIVKDDPGLLPVPRRRTYYRCILDSDLRIPVGSQVVQTARDIPSLLYCAGTGGRRGRRLERMGVIVRCVGRSGKGTVDIGEVLSDLGALGVMHLYVEGGSAVSSSFLRSRMVDKLAVFIAPTLMGDADGMGAFADLGVRQLQGCHLFELDQVRRVGKDMLAMLYPVRR